MSLVREEAREVGTLAALAATGPVITSAAIVLAGTLSVLMTLPITSVFDWGSRSPSASCSTRSSCGRSWCRRSIELLGDRAWWPSTATGGRTR